MGSFGDEVVNFEIERSRRTGARVAALLSEYAMQDRALRLYFEPGSFGISLADLSHGELSIPSNIELWFARGAFLLLESGVTLRVFGRIIAEPATIFALPEVTDLLESPGRAKVIIESEVVEEIHPEWFGAVPSLRKDLIGHPLTMRRNARALQACIHAACRDRVRRDGRALPPLTVVVRDPIDFDETLEVASPPGLRGVLWLRGDDAASRAGRGIAALQRYVRGNDGELPGAQTAALRVQPGVSVENQGVAIKVAVLNDDAGPDPQRDVGAVIEIEETDDTPRNRHVFIDAAGLVGARDAIVSIRDTETVHRGGSKVLSSSSRSTRYGLRDCSLDLRSGATSSARAAVVADLSQNAMVTISGGVIFQGVAPPKSRIDTGAGIVVRGASVFVRAVSMHLPEGPRPNLSGGGTESALPDGQDFWLDPGDGSLACHLTVMHLDSQSWWLLGGRPVLSDRAVGAVSLLNVGAGNVNWGDLQMASVRPEAVHSDGEQIRTLTAPPSIAWPGGYLPLLVEGCSFHRYVTIPLGQPGELADIGTVFSVPLNATDGAWWLQPSAIPEPRRWTREVRDTRTGALPRALVSLWSRAS